MRIKKLCLWWKAWKKRCASNNSRRTDNNKRRRLDDRRADDAALRIVTNKSFKGISNLFNVSQFNEKMMELTRPSIFDDPKDSKKDKNIFYYFSDLILNHFNFPIYRDKFILKDKCINSAKKFSFPFFLTSNLNFFRRINFFQGPLQHSNEWQVPEGVLQSLKHKNFQHHFNIKSGTDFFPFNYDESSNFMNIKNLKGSFLLNSL